MGVMTLDINAINQSCQTISRQVKESFKTLRLHYIAYHENQRTEAFALAGQEIADHPAARTATNIMARAQENEKSAVIGIAGARRPLLLGLASSTSILALCSVNADQYRSLKEVKRHAWHMAWQAIEAASFYSMRGGDGSMYGNDEIIVRKRNAMEVASAKLCADAFSVLMAGLNGDSGAAREAAIARSLDTLHAVPHAQPELYPYAIAMDATEAAVRMLAGKNLPKKKNIEIALRTTDEIGRTFDLATIRQWLAFAQPAQDMAWRGYKPEEILSAAINTSENTYVRSIGYMIAEMTQIKPSSILATRESYSPFSDDSFNEKLHERAVDIAFADAVSNGLKANSARPFLDEANRQNGSLTEGRALGWCASALQAAATAFEAALRGDREPALEARRLFDGERARTTWETLKNLGGKIVEQYRAGGIVTLHSLQELCGNEPALAPVKKSALTTMRSPSYQESLHAARELSARPAAPAIGMGPRPAAPAVQKSIMPGLGFGSAGHSARAATTTTTAEETGQE